jgi:hypothetical protein
MFLRYKDATAASAAAAAAAAARWAAALPAGLLR